MHLPYKAFKLGHPEVNDSLFKLNEVKINLSIFKSIPT